MVQHADNPPLHEIVASLGERLHAAVGAVRRSAWPSRTMAAPCCVPARC
jgi:hypothetical protein